ncbi:hypothetical protein [Escherichia coli]|nr:hypothetical protein [Escherichia coli]
MKIKLALLIAFAGFSAGASAEIAEFSFKDTLTLKRPYRLHPYGLIR